MGHFVITLVHGTFARGAKWTLEGSLLRDELRRQLEADGSTVSFASPEWSGGNSHDDRRKGSLSVRRCLLQQLRQQPGAQHFVIAHSHGGNVAMRAIRISPNLRSRISGVVTIATPFLLFKRESGRLIFLNKFIPIMRRDLFAALGGLCSLLAFRLILPFVLAFDKDPTESKSIWMRVVQAVCVLAVFAAFIGLGFLMVPWLRTHMPWMLDGPVVFWYLVIGLGLAIGFGALGIYSDARSKVFKLLARDLVRLRRGLFRRYAYAQPQAKFDARMRLLVLSSAFDEAQAALSSAWGLQLATRLWATSVSLFMLVVAGASLIAMIYSLVRLYDFLDLHPMLGDFAEQVIVLASIVGAIVMTFVLSVTTAIVSGVTERASPGLGFATRRLNLLISVQAQRQPGGGLVHDYRRFGVLELLRDAEGTLFHSRVYSSPRALKHIAGWMAWQGGHSCVPVPLASPVAV